MVGLLGFGGPERTLDLPVLDRVLVAGADEVRSLEVGDHLEDEALVLVGQVVGFFVLQVHQLHLLVELLIGEEHVAILGQLRPQDLALGLYAGDPFLGLQVPLLDPAEAFPFLH